MTTIGNGNNRLYNQQNFGKVQIQKGDQRQVGKETEPTKNPGLRREGDTVREKVNVQSMLNTPKNVSADPANVDSLAEKYANNVPWDKTKDISEIIDYVFSGKMFDINEDDTNKVKAFVYENLVNWFIDGQMGSIDISFVSQVTDDVLAGFPGANVNAIRNAIDTILSSDNEPKALDIAANCGDVIYKINQLINQAFQTL